ncbi:hypothetical protein Tco_0902935 [Tanacetum coccineum]
MVRLSCYNVVLIVILVACDLRLVGGRYDLWAFVDGCSFSHSSARFSGDLDIYFGFVDILWEAEGVRGGGREEINDGDKPSHGDGSA